VECWVVVEERLGGVYQTLMDMIFFIFPEGIVMVAQLGFLDSTTHLFHF